MNRSQWKPQKKLRGYQGTGDPGSRRCLPQTATLVAGGLSNARPHHHLEGKPFHRVAVNVIRQRRRPRRPLDLNLNRTRQCGQLIERHRPVANRSKFRRIGAANPQLAVLRESLIVLADELKRWRISQPLEYEAIRSDDCWEGLLTATMKHSILAFQRAAGAVKFNFATRLDPEELTLPPSIESELSSWRDSQRCH